MGAAVPGCMSPGRVCVLRVAASRIFPVSVHCGMPAADAGAQRG